MHGEYLEGIEEILGEISVKTSKGIYVMKFDSLERIFGGISKGAPDGIPRIPPQRIPGETFKSPFY